MPRPRRVLLAGLAPLSGFVRAPPQPSKASSPGSRGLSRADFAAVNGDPDTWSGRDGAIVCAGKQIGARIRARRARASSSTSSGATASTP